ncbi:MAG: hypothetical protein JWS12_114 [Candidatus Saccharibacteria bacterium]|nr:hypothetical protein [Candidatus Saccharibacteria bacterium]
MQLSQAITNRPILSLRTGGQVGIALEPIINPNNLKIEGWYCQDKFSKHKLLLVSRDVRDIIQQGIVVNDHEVLTDPDEVVRLKDILKLKFDLINKPVATEKKKKIGKVTDFATEMQSLYVIKLYVSQPILKNLSGGMLLVDRTQILEITTKKVVIQDPLQGKPLADTAPASAPAMP